MYYLMIKKQNKTNLKYLCQTGRKDPFLYTGSGTHWKSHLQQHGYDISTEILGEYKNKSDLKKSGEHYSKLYNVVESEEWANLRIEDGHGGDTSNTDGYKSGMEKRRSYVGKNNPNYGKVGSWAGKVGPMINKIWYNNGLEEHLFDTKPNNWVEGRLKINCTYCGKETSMMNNKRWHGKKCKNKKND